MFGRLSPHGSIAEPQAHGFESKGFNYLAQFRTGEEVTATPCTPPAVFHDYCSSQAPPSSSRARPGGAPPTAPSSRGEEKNSAPLPPLRVCAGAVAPSHPLPSPPPSGPARGAEPAWLGWDPAGISWFGAEEGTPAVASAEETKPRPGAQPGGWVRSSVCPQSAGRSVRRRLATGSPPRSRPRPRSPPPRPRPRDTSAGPGGGLDTSFHAVWVHNDAGKRVDVQGAGARGPEVCGVQGGDGPRLVRVGSGARGRAIRASGGLGRGAAPFPSAPDPGWGLGETLKQGGCLQLPWS